MLRLANIGTSAISANFVAASLRVPDVEFTTTFSRDASRAAAFAEANGVAAAVSDFQALLQADDVDAFYIASPNSVHFEQAIAAIRAGKHVLIEKPATPDSASFRLLMDEAASSGVVLLEAMRSAYDPAIEAIGELLPALGTLRRASFGLCQRSSRYDAFLSGKKINVLDPKMAGGALLDLGVYPLSTAVALFGAPVSAQGRSVLLPNGADGAGSVILEYPGFVVDIAYSKVSSSSRPNEIQGESGTLLIDQITNPRLLRLEPVHEQAGEQLIEKPAGELGNLHFALARFAQLIRDGEDCTADHQRTLDTLQIVDGLRASQ